MLCASFPPLKRGYRPKRGSLTFTATKRPLSARRRRAARAWATEGTRGGTALLWASRIRGGWRKEEVWRNCGQFSLNAFRRRPVHDLGGAIHSPLPTSPRPPFLLIISVRPLPSPWSCFRAAEVRGGLSSAKPLSEGGTIPHVVRPPCPLLDSCPHPPWPSLPSSSWGMGDVSLAMRPTYTTPRRPDPLSPSSAPHLPPSLSDDTA